MTDNEFCQKIGCTAEIKRALATQIRRITGELCKVDPSAITPDEDTARLNSRTFDGWDDLELLMRLEGIFGISLDEVELPNFTLERFFFFYKKAKPLNYGEWVKSVVEVLAPIVTERLK